MVPTCSWRILKQVLADCTAEDLLVGAIGVLMLWLLLVANSRQPAAQQRKSLCQNGKRRPIGSQIAVRSVVL
jgi:hypothetical protein